MRYLKIDIGQKKLIICISVKFVHFYQFQCQRFLGRTFLMALYRCRVINEPFFRFSFFQRSEMVLDEISEHVGTYKEFQGECFVAVYIK